MAMHARGNLTEENWAVTGAHREAAAVDGEDGAEQRRVEAVERLPQHEQRLLQTQVQAVLSPMSSSG